MDNSDFENRRAMWVIVWMATGFSVFAVALCLGGLFFLIVR